MSLARPAQRYKCDAIKPILLYTYRTIITRPCEGLKVRAQDSCREACCTLRACPYIYMHAIVFRQTFAQRPQDQLIYFLAKLVQYMPHLPKKTKNINSLQLLQHLYRVLHYIGFKLFLACIFHIARSTFDRMQKSIGWCVWYIFREIASFGPLVGLEVPVKIKTIKN